MSEVLTVGYQKKTGAVKSAICKSAIFTKNSETSYSPIAGEAPSYLFGYILI